MSIKNSPITVVYFALGNRGWNRTEKKRFLNCNPPKQNFSFYTFKIGTATGIVEHWFFRIFWVSLSSINNGIGKKTKNCSIYKYFTNSGDWDKIVKTSINSWLNLFLYVYWLCLFILCFSSKLHNQLICFPWYIVSEKIIIFSLRLFDFHFLIFTNFLTSKYKI